jgi:bla regulator protein blaR1
VSAAAFAGWMADALIATTLLMGAVLLVRGPVRRAFGPQVAYALWALPALRFLLPSLPPGWWRGAAATPVTRAGETITVLVVEPASAVSLAAAPVPLWWLGPALALAWGAGAAAFFGYHYLRHRAFCRRMLRTAEPVQREGDVLVVASEAAPGPLAFGVWRRYVAFPRDFAERYEADERALALAHELGHHARRDLLANWAALIVLALHWFNPIAWRAFHAFRADQELANDARVLAGRSATERHAYACAIVKAAHGGPISAACHLHTISDLKGRLRMLTTSGASRRRLAAGFSAVTLLAAGGLGLTASGSRAAEVIKESVGEALQTPPASPAPPAPAAPAVAASPAAPPAPPAPVEASKAAKKKHVVVVTKDGKTETFEGADADRYIAEKGLMIPPIPPMPPMPMPQIAISGLGEHRVLMHGFRTEKGKDGKLRTVTVTVPEVVRKDCPGDATAPVVENVHKDGKHRIVICTNRIERMSREAERLAARSVIVRRDAMMNARANLAMARVAIERDRNLSDQQRSQALAGIAQAEAGLRKDDAE